MPSTSTLSNYILFDAGMFIGALLRGDARHAAIAIVSGVRHVYTYDMGDWHVFSPDGLTITGPNSILGKLP